jgi:hypothetical protein
LEEVGERSIAEQRSYALLKLLSGKTKMALEKLFCFSSALTM